MLLKIIINFALSMVRLSLIMQILITPPYITIFLKHFTGCVLIRTHRSHTHTHTEHKHTQSKHTYRAHTRTHTEHSVLYSLHGQLALLVQGSIVWGGVHARDWTGCRTLPFPLYTVYIWHLSLPILKMSNDTLAREEEIAVIWSTNNSRKHPANDFISMVNDICISQ